jgi:exopolysaccharide biosynthesis polyprenyl glycosylphosphotransferase
VEIIHAHAAECVFVASTGTSASDFSRIARACRLTNIEMRVSANAPDVLTSRVNIQQIGELMMLSVRPVRLTGPQAALKRSFDIILASLALVVFLPLMGMIALAIKLTSRGPALFRQERVTKGGRPFTMYKFRTMAVDPQEAGGAVGDETQPYFKLAHDPRITRLGRALRPFSLDELPQFWNVLTGSMSLVGPRPHAVSHNEEYRKVIAGYMLRHKVRPGITGWAQIHGRARLPWEERIELDVWYVEHRSPWLDLKILARTPLALLAGTYKGETGGWRG